MDKSTVRSKSIQLAAMVTTSNVGCWLAPKVGHPPYRNVFLIRGTLENDEKNIVFENCILGACNLGGRDSSSFGTGRTQDYIFWVVTTQDRILFSRRSFELGVASQPCSQRRTRENISKTHFKNTYTSWWLVLGTSIKKQKNLSSVSNC